LFFFGFLHYPVLWHGTTKTNRVPGNEENQRKTKIKMLRRNSLVIKSVESALSWEESLWWERFVEEVGFEAGVKE